MNNNCVLKHNVKGFALIEVLIAAGVLSIILLSIYSGISTSMKVISGARNRTYAVIIARSVLNEFRYDKMRGMDLSEVPADDYPGFTYSRVTVRYENPLTGALPANKTTITVTWKDNTRDKNYTLSYIYPTF